MAPDRVMNSNAKCPRCPDSGPAFFVIDLDRALRLAVKLGFSEVERFEEYGAEQWFGVWSPATLS